MVAARPVMYILNNNSAARRHSSPFEMVFKVPMHTSNASKTSKGVLILLLLPRY